MRAILVPVDGSSLAETALPTALALARRTPGTRVEAVVVLAAPAEPLRVSGAPAFDRQLDHDLRAVTEHYADSLRERLPAMAPDVPTSLTLLRGQPVERIAAHASEGPFDLIVMTTHGRSGISRAWLGSVADGLLRHSSVPILLLRDVSAAAPVAGEALFSDVVVPLDEGRVSEEILSDALVVAGAGARYHLIHVVVPLRWLPPPSAFEVVTAGDAGSIDPADLVSGMRDAAVRHLGAVAEQLRARGVEVKIHIPVHQHPAEAILACAHENGAGLIAMTSHGRGTAGRVFLGSVADKVVRGAAVPVLVRVPSDA